VIPLSALQLAQFATAALIGRKFHDRTRLRSLHADLAECGAPGLQDVFLFALRDLDVALATPSPLAQTAALKIGAVFMDAVGPYETHAFLASPATINVLLVVTHVSFVGWNLGTQKA
jgi:hypothetical protein